MIMKKKSTPQSPLLNRRTSGVTSGARQSIISSLFSIVIGLFIGSIIIVIVGAVNENMGAKSIIEGVKLVFFGLFSTGRDAAGELTFGFNPVNIGDMLFRATPLILTGLSVAVAFKTGLFNIGAPGQYLMGTAGTLYLALAIPQDKVNPTLIWVIAFLGGVVIGALWGAISGLFKALLNVNEVIACIMTNWIAANLVTWFFESHEELKNSYEYGKVGYVCKTSFNGVETAKLGLDKIFPNSQVNGGIIIAAVIAVLIYILMSRTTLGYKLKACGANRHAAKYAGINDKGCVVLSMAIAGGLAGSAAALYWLSGNTEFFWSTYQSLPAVGFNGIPVALLATNNPIAVIFSGIFMSMLNISGLQIKNLTTYNEYLTDIIIAVIVYMSAFSLFIKNALEGRAKKAVAKKAESASSSAEKAGEDK